MCLPLQDWEIECKKSIHTITVGCYWLQLLNIAYNYLLLIWTEQLSEVDSLTLDVKIDELINNITIKRYRFWNVVSNLTVLINIVHCPLYYLYVIHAKHYLIKYKGINDKTMMKF